MSFTSIGKIVRTIIEELMHRAAPNCPRCGEVMEDGTDPLLGYKFCGPCEVTILDEPTKKISQEKDVN